MKSPRIFFLVIFSTFLFNIGCNYDTFENYQEEISKKYGYAPFFSAKADYITDLMLIYQGASFPVTYNRDEFLPYVYTEKDGKFKWVFDGFLFIEIQSETGRRFGDNANKTDWEWLINRQIQSPGVGVHALNDVLDSLKSVGKTPDRKRKVVIAIPSPGGSDFDWGEIDGVKLNMTTNEDKIKSVEWFIDKVIDAWKKSDFSELELSGFYWLHEGESQYTFDRLILPEISNYVKSHGFLFYWIPYFGAHMGAEWKDWGFDIAYQQPNYFFRHENEEWPVSRMDDACHFASKYNMGLEMEFNYSISDTLYQRRFKEYLDYFDKHRVYKEAPMAHYEDRGALIYMANSTNDTIKSLFNSYIDFIVERQRRADDLYKTGGIK